MFYCYGITEKGIKQKNEDAVLLNKTVLSEGCYETKLTPPFIIGVCDGVSGENTGDIAAKTCLKQLANLEYSSEVNIQKKVYQIHKYLQRYGKLHKKSFNMQTTLCALTVDEKEELSVVNVGDSRLYLFRNSTLKQLTKDQSLVQVLYERGKIAYEEKRKHIHRNIIFPALGNNDDKPQVDVKKLNIKMEYGDMVLICSDGLTDYVINAEIEEILAKPLHITKRLEELVELALQKGGRDNISIVAVLMID